MSDHLSGTIVLASHNAGKLREIAALLLPYDVEVKSAKDFGLSEPDETEETFAGNARLKAHHAARETGLPALSDDSGLSVIALDGRPGVHTADWAETEHGRDFDMAMEKVWQAVQITGRPAPYSAAFHCTLCLAFPDGSDKIFEGTVEGVLVWPKRGDRGFGFDPMFLPEGETETLGEMDPERKHAISHRSLAFEKFVKVCFD
ncbi:XTP/dITP diphosphohydrolase [Poseidonocella pacifica]|uniref:dITP/XTP pyrophosphatase n=1 Tax=Poseidonocella pacifica TaxID=871651 RepID=A0A1I0XXX2_9RHOB|nr:non-canonical purine NTP pyrophosphatase [Poseidonocella pacifica]SFB04783.1 XTP/dITP diphosphohydrolase [Poseidonocella pacifica]